MEYVNFKGPASNTIYAVVGGKLVHVPNPAVMSYQQPDGWDNKMHDVNDANVAKKKIARALADLPTSYNTLPKAMGGV